MRGFNLLPQWTNKSNILIVKLPDNSLHPVVAIFKKKSECERNRLNPKKYRQKHSECKASILTIQSFTK